MKVNTPEAERTLRAENRTSSNACKHFTTGRKLLWVTLERARSGRGESGGDRSWSPDCPSFRLCSYPQTVRRRGKTVFGGSLSRLHSHSHFKLVLLVQQEMGRELRVWMKQDGDLKEGIAGEDTEGATGPRDHQETTPVMDRVYLQKAYVKNLTPNMIIFGRGTLEEIIRFR